MVTFTTDELIDALDWYALCGNKIKAAAREAGMSRNAMRRRIRAAQELGLEPSGDDPREHFLSAAQRGFAEESGIPASQLSHGWVKNDTGSHFYSVERPRDDPKKLSEALIDGLSGMPRAVDTGAPDNASDDLLAVLPIFDAHIGMLAREGATGASWDRKSALERVSSGVARMVASAPVCGEALIIFGGDTSHTDNKEAVTPRGRNPLDADGSYFEIVASTIGAIKIAVDIALRKFSRVRVRVLRGNHDEHVHVALTLAAAEHYRDHIRVIVEQSESDYLAYEFGANFIMAHHGDKAKPESLTMFAADQYAPMWGRTKHRLILSGHIHHEKRKDVGGATVESMRSLARRDDYAVSHGYVGRSTTYLIILHRVDGEILRIKMNYA